MIYKILRDGRSCHGGTLVWSLPVRGPDGAWTPGEWHEVDGPIVPCIRGLHVTTTPAYWWPGVGGEAYVVEVDGERYYHAPLVTVVLRARLMRRLDVDELRRLRIYLDGTATVSSGHAVADGTAHVTARGDANITALGQATVTAYDHAEVWYASTAHVEVHDRARSLPYDPE